MTNCGGVKDLVSKRSGAGGGKSASARKGGAAGNAGGPASRRTLDVHHSNVMAGLEEKKREMDRLDAEVRRLEEQAVQHVAAAKHAEAMRCQADITRAKDARETLEREFAFVHNHPHASDIAFRYYSTLSNGSFPPHVGNGGAAGAAGSILSFFSPPPSPPNDDHGGGGRPAASNNAAAAAATTYDRSRMLGDYLHVTYNRMPVAPPDTSSTAASSATPHASAATNGGANGANGYEPPPCQHCGSEDVRVYMQEGMTCCNACGTAEFIVVDSDKPSFKDQPKEIHYWSYKRSNHLNECLNQMQGKETTDISDELVERITAELRKRRITNMADVTAPMLRSILKKLNESKYYEHLASLLQRLNGASLPYLPPDLEKKIKTMFAQMQMPYVKHAPKGRSNFMSYNFCVYKCLQLLGYDEYLENNECQFIKLLKTRDKLQEQDKVWSKICAELRWEFLPSM